MNKLKIFSIFTVILILMFTLALTACGEPPATPVGIVMDWMPPETVASGDSIVMTQSGPSYAGNTRGSSSTTLSPVKIKQVILKAGTIQVNLSYRESIDSARGETHYMIITSFLTGKSLNTDTPNNPVAGVSLYTKSAPKGLVIKDVMQWMGGLSNSNVLQFDIAGDMSTGQHTFEIGVIVNGTDFGTLPCTLTVTK